MASPHPRKKRVVQKIPSLAPSCGGELKPCPECLQLHYNRMPILSQLITEHKFMSVAEISAQKVVFKLPKSWFQCEHLKPQDELLGSGSFGAVKPISKVTCAKYFKDTEDFFHELVVCNLASIAQIRQPTKSVHLVRMTGACIPCKCILFPRYAGSLYDFNCWEQLSAKKLAKEFRNLINTVNFLNDEVGIIHSDISTSNILVAHGPDFPGRFMLADLGLATLHSGNHPTEICLKSSRGKILYNMACARDVFLLCKDPVKPAQVIFRCYLLACKLITSETLHQNFIVGKILAQNIDIASLFYTMLECVEKMIDSKNIKPSCQFYKKIGPDNESHRAYFLQFLVPRVIILEMLSKVWDTKLSIGIDSLGNTTEKNILEGQDKTLFASWCADLKGLIHKGGLQSNLNKLRALPLYELVLLFLKFDYFSLSGRP
ncbi:orf 36 [Ateline gammaherpesvirus 3]|uniref:Orf 36 n=1 Tax=Ateline herpesvirus 3 TaxID=85618 RepID=Q9YTM9_ATHV3|nr:orf 36 [Ateline gammaherpesvirus 3]AAC95562.1 orf 36 [Ateline gammaherpesvirus 3]